MSLAYLGNIKRLQALKAGFATALYTLMALG